MKQMRVPGRTVVGSLVNFTPLAFSSAAMASMPVQVSEMIEALIGCGRRRIHAIARFHRGNEDIGTAELYVDSRLALLHRADDLAAQHAFEPLRGRFRVRAAKMDVVPSQLRHGGRLPVSPSI
jgi:hypothetical protein